MHDTATTVCRSFAFINLNIPPQINPAPFDCNYLTIGFFDGLKTELLDLPEGNQRSLSSMWYYNEQLALAMDGRYSFQNTFGFRDIDRAEELYFWSDETVRKYPLTFVTFLQMQPKKEEKQVSLRDKLRVLEDKLKEDCDGADSGYIVACYATLDKNDYIVCIKSKKYNSIASCILKMHEVDFPQKILYSYSVFSLNQKWLDEFTRDPSIFDSDEIIDSICLKGIANSYTQGDLSEKYKRLRCVLEDTLFPNKKDPKDPSGQEPADSRLYDILGDYDFRYIARNVPLKNLLKAIADSKGALHYDGIPFRFALFSSSLVLNTSSGSFKYKKEEEERESELEKAEVERMKCSLSWPMCQHLMDRLMPQNSDLSSELSEQSLPYSLEHSAYLTNFVSLWKLLSSLAALERAPTRKYDFHSLFWPFRMLLQYLTDLTDIDQGNPDDKAAYEAFWNDDRNLYGFIHGLSSTLHGTLRTDIQFFQINDFNAIVHYAPAKLRAFYSAWVYKLTECYQLEPIGKRMQEYEFIVVPNTYTVIRTYEFYSERRIRERLRLMRIEIPERFIYQPDLVCIYLTHEVAHFVGTDIRCRPKRHYVFLEILGNIILTQYCTTIVTSLVDGDLVDLAKAFVAYANRTQKHWRLIMTELLAGAVGEDVLKNPHLQSNTFMSAINTALELVLGRPAAGLKSNMEDRRSNRTQVDRVIRDIYLAFLSELHTEPGQDFSVEAMRFLDRCVTRITNGEYAETLGSYLTPKMHKSILSVILMQMKEAQADIFSVFMLGLGPEKYIHGFLKSGLIPSNSHKVILTHRLFIVFSTLEELHKTDVSGFPSSDWQTPFTCADGRDVSFETEEFHRLIKKLQEYPDQLFHSLCSPEETLPIMPVIQDDVPDADSWGGRGYFALHSGFVAGKIIEYLKECAQQFTKRFRITEVQERHRKILEAFATLSEKSLLEQADMIDALLFEYENARQADWKTIAESPHCKDNQTFPPN